MTLQDAGEKRGRGRPPDGDRAMTGAQRQARYRGRTELTAADWDLVGQVMQAWYNSAIHNPAARHRCERVARVLDKLYRTGRADRPAPMNVRRFL